MYEDQPFGEIAKQLEISEENAKKRYQRAMPKLAKKVECLKTRDIEGFVG